ncbi:MAG: TetR/AcrR family transcriptional regulator [Luminiphilus sp.]
MAAPKRRAVTDAQKQFRREEILSGARTYFETVGYESFSMAQLAARLGIVKGTLYLYFPTKEAIILALFGRALEAWSEVVKARLTKPITDDQFLQAFHDTAMKDPILVPLLIRLQHVIEHNVSIPLLIDSKRHFQNCLGTIAERAVSALNLVESQANELIWSLGVLLSGAAQSDQGPALSEEDLPEDVANLMTSLSSERLFLTNGKYILEGIRRNT